MGPEVNLVNPAYETAISLDGLLRQNGIRQTKMQSRNMNFMSAMQKRSLKNLPIQ